MYEVLMKQLKYCANSDPICEATAVCPFYDQREEETHDYRCVERMMSKASDAIEELQKDLERSKEYEAFWEKEANEALRKFQVAIASKPRWIPVTERLPESGVCVLVTDGLEVGEGWLTEITNTRGYFMRWCAPTADIDVDRRPIAYWMPLPTPPKEET